MTLPEALTDPLDEHPGGLRAAVEVAAETIRSHVDAWSAGSGPALTPMPAPVRPERNAA
ncbi:hypothetical protein ABZ234_07870 [Nocardiopsis sp. NPDC006198]|uniref:hypothetical protein n=1 Tax=Nocardiopsis sp. NPDC006198 TaxID=3154472 RepID=UPI0033AC94B4